MFGDIMGLGKTIEAIVTANAMVPHRILVVCPASVLFTWRREIWKWQTLGLPVLLIQAGLDTTINHGLFRWGVNGPPARVALCRKEWREKMPRRRQISMSRTATEIPNAPLPSFPRGRSALDLRDGLVSPVASGATENCRSSRLSTVVAVNCRPRAERYARVAPRRNSRRQCNGPKQAARTLGFRSVNLKDTVSPGQGRVTFSLALSATARSIYGWTEIRAARPPRCHSVTPTRPRPKPSPSNRSCIGSSRWIWGVCRRVSVPICTNLLKAVSPKRTGTGY